jgi:hypothetical protein
MSKFFTALFLLLAVSSFGQDEKLLDVLPMKDGKVTYTGIIQVDSSDKSKLYNKAKKWFIEQYKSAKDVIQLDDKENGEIIGKGYFETVWQMGFGIAQKVNDWHTVKVSVKDNKFKYEITDFRVKYYVSSSQYSRGSDVDVSIEDFGKNREKNAKKYYAQVDKEVISIISSLEKFMKAPAKDDW